MKNCTAASVLLFVAVCFFSCAESKNEADSPPNDVGGQIAEAPPGQNWLQIRQQKNCADSSGNRCQGFHGFTVRSDGQYIVGPAEGVEFEGGVDGDELARISSIANRLVESDLSASCTQASSNEKIEITFSSGKMVSCAITTGNSVQDLSVLNTRMNTLLTKYYPTPFPSDSSDCNAATARLLTSYRQVRACNIDSDCNYVERFFDIVSRSELNHDVTTFDCQAVSPFLIVANGARTNAEMVRLTSEQKAQAEACKNPPGTITCLAFGTFESKNLPVCRNNVCARSF